MKGTKTKMNQVTIISIPVNDRFIIINIEDSGKGTVGSSLREACFYCKEKEYNLSIKTIEFLVLSHACLGVDVIEEKYVEGVEELVNYCSRGFTGLFPLKQN
ncbi:MAG TPA: hypothetical protein VMZ91_06490 [Candidatus Paceibacterota bacterium]|nr:hypothetical protein [Candidatus Paceibacterota bacterium]